MWRRDAKVLYRTVSRRDKTACHKVVLHVPKERDNQPYDTSCAESIKRDCQGQLCYLRPLNVEQYPGPGPFPTACPRGPTMCVWLSFRPPGSSLNRPPRGESVFCPAWSMKPSMMR